MKPRRHGYSHFRHLQEELLSRWVAEGNITAMSSEMLKRDLSTVASRMKQLRTRQPHWPLLFSVSHGRKEDRSHCRALQIW